MGWDAVSREYVLMALTQPRRSGRRSPATVRMTPTEGDVFIAAVKGGFLPVKAPLHRRLRYILR